MSMKSINIPLLARVEGEGALALDIEDKRIKSLALRIFEPPRFFEKFLEERSYSDVVDIVARICGICPVAYQMGAAHAIESIFGINPGPWVREMRRLFYCGEWIQSHALHVHLLAAPDFLHFNNAIEMAGKYPDEVKRGVALKQLGCDLISLLGVRSVHPVGACVGGFYHIPAAEKAAALLERLKAAEKDAVDMVRWVASLPIPEFSQDINFVSLRHPEEYPLNEGNIISSKGLDITIDRFNEYFREFHAPQSTALHCLLDNKPYLVGPLARLNNNQDLLPQKVKNIIDEIGLKLPSQNMFHSIIARAVETYYAILESIRILETNYLAPSTPRVEVTQTAGGWGYGCTEAPRGICWHRYRLDENGIVKHAQIVPPTSQNQPRIEEDLRLTLEQYGLDKSDDELRLMSEMVIRNYDPCISCSVHFLDLTVTR